MQAKLHNSTLDLKWECSWRRWSCSWSVWRRGRGFTTKSSPRASSSPPRPPCASPCTSLVNQAVRNGISPSRGKAQRSPKLLETPGKAIHSLSKCSDMVRFPYHPLASLKSGVGPVNTVSQCSICFKKEHNVQAMLPSPTPFKEILLSVTAKQ